MTKQNPTTVTVTDDLMANPTAFHAFVAGELQRLGSFVLRREQCSQQRNTIESAPDILGGRPCIAGTRVPASAIWEFHKAGYTPTAIIREYPTVSPEQVAAAIAFMMQATICPRCGWEAPTIPSIGPCCPNPDCDAFDDMRPLSHADDKRVAVSQKMPGLSRVVLTPAGRFGSLTLAANHYGISRQTAYYRAKNSRLGWQYVRDRG